MATFARHAVALLTIVAALLGAGGGVRAQSASEPALVRVATGPVGDVAPLLYAQRVGLFKKAGLNVQLTRMNSGGAAMSAVIDSSIEIGHSTLLSVLTAHAKGIPLSLVAPGSLYIAGRPTVSAVVQTASTIKTGSDMNGKVISSVTLRDINVLATRAWIDRHGGNSSTVTFVEVPPLDAVVAVIQGRIDVATLSNPSLSEALSSGKTRVVAPVFDAISRRYLLTGWFAMNDYADVHGDVVRRFAEVMRAAEAYCNAHPEGTIDLVARYTGMSAALLAHMVPTEYPPGIEPREVQPVIDAAVKYKWFDRGFAAADAISPYAVKAAARR